MKKCPFCSEEVQEEAIKCKFCKEFIGAPAPTEAAVKANPPEIGVTSLGSGTDWNRDLSAGKGLLLGVLISGGFLVVSLLMAGTGIFADLSQTLAAISGLLFPLFLFVFALERIRQQKWVQDALGLGPDGKPK